VRSVNYRRHDEELVSLGTWRIEMLRAMKKYVAEKKEQQAVKPSSNGTDAVTISTAQKQP
jgi:hypothetical protein